MITTEIAEKFLTLSHGRTRYLEAGSGYPTILLHGVGFTSGGDNWALSMGQLATRFRVLAPDFVGWGLGDRLDWGYGHWYLADFVREFQDALGMERANFIGHSMGGWVASLLAYESPDRLNKLVLVSSAGTRTQTLPHIAAFAPPTRESIRAQLPGRINVPGVNLDAMADELAKRVEIPGAVEAYQRIMDAMNHPVMRQQYNTVRRLPHIKAPTLVIWGRDDQTHPVEMGEITHRLIPGSKLLIFENCGHFVYTERPGEFIQAVLDFL